MNIIEILPVNIDFMSLQAEKLTYKIRGAIYEVHNILGPGLFEECYHQALLHELKLRGLKVESKVKVPVIYKGIEVKDAYEVDMLVEDSIIIELKSVEELSPKHFKQLINYLHLMNLHIGYLVNFNCIFMREKKDIRRVFNNEASDKTDL